jgi:hypothetical protein
MRCFYNVFCCSIIYVNRKLKTTTPMIDNIRASLVSCC